MLLTLTACADPASTSQNVIKLKPGVVTKIIILIPYGHKALAKLRFLRGATQIIPHVGWIQGDGETLEWSEMIDVATDEVWTVEVVNDDSLYPHCFYVRIEIQPRTIAKPFDHILNVIKKMMEVLGIE